MKLVAKLIAAAALLLSQCAPVVHADPPTTTATRGNAQAFPLDTAIPNGLNFVVAGDSLSIVHGSGITTDWPTQLFTMLSPNRATLVNTAVSGRALADISTGYTAEVHPYRPSATGHPAILAVWIGANDYNTVSSAATYAASLATYCTAAQTDGFTVVLFTIERRSDYDAEEAIRLAINALIRNGIAGVSRIVDVDALLADTATTTVDGIHHMDPWKIRIARRVAASLVAEDPGLDPLQYVPLSLSVGDVTAKNIGGNGILNLVDANTSIVSLGGTRYTKYYTFGDTQANGGGHLFYTGGVKGAQSLKFQIADDAALLKEDLYLFGNVAHDFHSVIFNGNGSVSDGLLHAANGTQVYSAGAGILKVSDGTNASTALLQAANGIVSIAGGTTGGLAITGSGMGGQNALKLTAGSSGDYSAVCFFDEASGIEHGAIGWGNSTTGNALQSHNYWELSDLNTDSRVPQNAMLITQTSLTTHGAGAYAQDPRISIGADLGPIVFTSYDPTTRASCTFTLSSTSCFFQDSTTQYGEIGYDDNACTVFRNGNDSNAYFSFGGTLSGGKGHKFYSGGVRASQGLRMQIADDGIAIDALLNINASAVITPNSAPGSPVEGQIYYDSATHHFEGWNGTAWKQLDN